MRARTTIAILALLAIAACHSPTNPDDSASLPHGRLSGLVTIGPFCPVERVDQPCPTPPSAYAERKVLVYDEKVTRLLHTVDIDSRGLYLIDLRPGRYTIDVKKVGIDRTSDVPTVVTIIANSVTRLDIKIDTGIR